MLQSETFRLESLQTEKTIDFGLTNLTIERNRFIPRE